ncbi:MAG: GYD domain-containing protein [Candidatus Dormibacteraeota bacterium]|uniref:GYD domain protein n=1 Tax=Candidatus Aeolococcus gillhamiae TaxID=3127015 RepID=A0A2W5YY86_9BACT|nr:GYD domain-containing protein [Candidatus Dormibacteraeota bacterium]PZR77923.1 MAG: GYD domain protein [Candidatus Dormibacter sp. RRmetagenome_bin12]
MPKYLFEASYTVEGVKGLIKEGGTSRRTNFETAVKGLGGSLESFYYVFGEDDVVGVLDMPDNVSIAALSLSVGASGAVSTSVRVLLTPEEIDAAVKKTTDYRAPGK